jgi:hypothetical protein
MIFPTTNSFLQGKQLPKKVTLEELKSVEISLSKKLAYFVTYTLAKQLERVRIIASSLHLLRW